MDEKFVTDEEYTDYFGNLNGLRSRVAGRIPVCPGMRILDLACGYGYFTIELAGLFPDVEVAGIDISNSDISNAIDRIGKLDMSDRIKIFEMDSTDLSFSHNSFDLAANFLGLEDIHMTRGRKGVERTFQEIERVLRPGGYFCFTVMPPDEMETEAQRIEVALFSYICGSTWLESSEYESILEGAGFTLASRESFLTGKKLTANQARQEIGFACENVPHIYGIQTPSFEDVWNKFGGEIERHGLGHYSKVLFYTALKMEKG